MDIGKTIARIERDLAALKSASRLSHASIENTAIMVNDGTGSLRAIVGVQADGTTAVNVVNGGAPPVPSTPTVAPAVGGLAIGWDGKFANSTPCPLDWARVEVHASPTAGFVPSVVTLQATIETPQGGIAYVPFTGPGYVCLLSRNTSGTASAPTGVVGPYSPRPVAGEIGVGEILSTMIGDGAVTTPKLFANAVTTAKLAVGSVDATAIAVDALTGKIITGGTITGALLQTAASGQRITLNEASANKILVYNASGTAIGELSASGLLVKGTNGAIIQLDPNDAFPNLKLTNTNQTASAVINVSGANAVLGMNSGLFTAGTNTDMKWRTLFGYAASASTDFWAAERTRDGDTSFLLGGRIFMDGTSAQVGFRNSADITQDAVLSLVAGRASLSKARLTVAVPASANPALFVNADTGHTGSLLSLAVNAVEKVGVDKDGNLSASGTITAASSNTTTGLVAASGFTVNNFYAYRFGKVVALDLYLKRSGTTISATSGNITPDVQIATVPAGWRPTHTTINAAWDDGTSTGGWVIGTDGICTLRTATSDIIGEATSSGNGRNLRLHITFIQD
ncbi:hypothetical protein [Streptomyces sp. NPDC007074]|uniref:hypothetical protein n=1 Tax=Streptomyces sp. NPDC007074 TaxID=3156764 RepID=UPI0033F0D1A9